MDPSPPPSGGRNFSAGPSLANPVLLEARVQLPATETEEPGSLRVVATAFSQGFLDEIAFDGFEIDATGRKHLAGMDGTVAPRRRRNRAPPRHDRQVLASDQPTVAQEDGALDGVAQLAHVSRPGVVEEPLLRVL